MSDSLDTGEKKLEALADVLEEAMPKLNYDQRNVAYVNYLYETGAMDDPNSIRDLFIDFQKYLFEERKEA